MDGQMYFKHHSDTCIFHNFFFRAFIFPLLIRGGKPTPCVPFAMALLFCIINGYLQAGYLLYHAPQNEIDCYTAPLFIAGKLIDYINGR